MFAKSRFALFCFGLLAIFLFVAYCGFFFVVPQTPGRSTRASASLASDFPLWAWIVSLPIRVPNDAISVAILIVALTIVVFAAYGLVVYLSSRLQPRPGLMALVLFPACAFLLLSTFALPNLNTDIFNYMLRGRLAAVYNKNPYVAAADEITYDPVYPYASHAYTGDPEWWKLPLWTSIEIGLAKLTGQDVARNLLIYRAAFSLVNIINLVLLAFILNKIYPQFLYTGLVVYAWNPVIVLLGQSKGDTFIVLFLLLAVLLLVLERRNLAIVPMTMSVLIKLTTLPFAAVYLLTYLKRKRWRDYIILGILIAVIAAFFYLRFGLGGFLSTQLLSIVGMSGADAPDFLRIILRVVFVVLIFAVGLTRSGDQKQMISGWLLLALYFSLFLINHEKAWYLIPLIALASLVPDWRFLSMTYVISFSGFLIYTWYSGFSTEFAPPFMISHPRFLIYLILPIVVVLAVGVVLLWERLHLKLRENVGIIPPSFFQQDK